ncbi:MAG: Two-component response regulator [Chloroflexi bacterium]|nr:Two-component response regulator [Chloroflexota bacterium]
MRVPDLALTFDPDPPQRVLVVDDEPLNLDLMLAYLEPEGYQVTTVTSGHEALAAVAASPPDLILLDAMMPGLDGFTVCARLKATLETRLIPVVVVTALAAVEERIHAINVGADDFLSKPVYRLELIARCRSLLRAKRFADELETVEHVIRSLTRAIEARDGYTERHTERVTGRAGALGMNLGLNDAALRTLQMGCMLHDVGKIGIPEAVLSKPGKLSEEEFAVMRRHPMIGVEICRPLRSRIIIQALPIIQHHHERIDGMGYPDGLRGVEIPLLARIAAIADAYDALTSDRPYRSRMSVEQAVAVLRAGAGTQWDSELVSAFLTLDTGILDAHFHASASVANWTT